MPKVNVMTIRIPAELKDRIEITAKLEGVSINQFALYAFTKELSELDNSQYYTNLLKDKNKEEIIKGFDEVFGKVKDRDVEEWDKL